MQRSIFLLTLIAIVACGRDAQREQPPREQPLADAAVETDSVQPPSESAAADSAWSRASVEREGQSDAVAMSTLVDVRAARHDDFERLVFEFDGPLPGYRVQVTPGPAAQCGSGQAVELPGNTWLQIRFFPSRAHTEAGRPTVARRDQLLQLPNLKRLKLICDFEAVLEWAAAPTEDVAFRVIELSAPPRLVIDLAKRH